MAFSKSSKIYVAGHNGMVGSSIKRKLDNNGYTNIITKNKTQCNIGKYFEHLEEPESTTDISQMMYSKAKKLLNWSPRISLNEMIDNMLEHDIKNVKYFQLKKTTK